MLFEDKEYGVWESTCYRVTVKGNLSLLRRDDFQRQRKLLSIEQINSKIKRETDNLIKLKEGQSYTGNRCKMIFIDQEYGEFSATLDSILSGHFGKKRGSENRKKTNIEKYGCSAPMQNPNIVLKSIKTNLKKYGVKNPQQDKFIALKSIRSAGQIIEIPHWKTNEMIPCQGGYEVKTVQYFNNNQIDFEAQSKVFMMPNGKTYRPDFYLSEQDKWIEVKGYMRKDAQEKWEWFHEVYPNSELWDKKKLKELGIL